MTTDQDVEHLRLLSIFHYVVGGITAIFSLFPCIHLTIGVMLVSGAFDELTQRNGAAPPTPPMPEFFGWMFVFIPLCIILFGLAMTVCMFLAGTRLASRRSYTFCLVVGGVECLFMPLGTILGIFTIIVLLRPSVRERFEMKGLG